LDALDGNAIAGHLTELFGTELTTAEGTCVHCGGASLIAELTVYPRAPGTVVRCPHCGQVVIMIVTIRGRTHIHHRWFDLERSWPAVVA
jgi:ribosomal protein S27AE